MSESISVTGVMSDDKTVLLDCAFPHCGEKVRVSVDLMNEQTRTRRVEAFLAELRRMQATRGDMVTTAEKLEDMIRSARPSWGD